MVKSLDSDSSIFQGLELYQKFVNRSNFERKFIWVNISNRTIHMSTFTNKERSHKEANLSEVTSITAGPPTIISKDEEINVNGRCLTIHFQKGGGIDLKFASEKERNNWYDTLRKIIIYINAIKEE